MYDSSPDGVLPTPSLILDDNSFLGNVNLNSSERFAILHDEVVPGNTFGYMPSLALLEVVGLQENSTGVFREALKCTLV